MTKRIVPNRLIGRSVPVSAEFVLPQDEHDSLGRAKLDHAARSISGDAEIQATRKAFQFVFFGLLLVFADLSFNGFDILPDFVGYILLAIGCGWLRPISGKFAYARTLAFVLAACQLILVVLEGDVARFVGYVATSANCGMIWELMGGVMEFVRQTPRASLASRAHVLRIMNLVILGIATLIDAADIKSAPLGVIIAVAVLTMIVVMLHLVWVVGSIAGNKRPASTVSGTDGNQEVDWDAS